MGIKRVAILWTIVGFVVPLCADGVKGDLILNGGNYGQYSASGNATLSDAKFDSLRVTGRLAASNLMVKGELNVDGNAKLDNVSAASITARGCLVSDNIKAATMTVYGSCVVNGGIIQKDATVIGSMVGQGTHFKGVLTVRAKKIELENCHIGSLVVQENKSYSLWRWIKSWFSSIDVCASQDVYLQKETIVEGDITFEGGKGKIYKSSKSKIKGKVIGGVVEQQ